VSGGSVVGDADEPRLRDIGGRTTALLQRGALGARRTGRSGRALGAGRSVGAGGTVLAGGARLALGALRTGRALLALWAGRTGLAGRPP